MVSAKLIILLKIITTVNGTKGKNKVKEPINTHVGINMKVTMKTILCMELEFTFGLMVINSRESLLMENQRVKELCNMIIKNMREIGKMDHNMEKEY